jgi:iron complex outermembrane recepter protein
LVVRTLLFGILIATTSAGDERPTDLPEVAIPKRPPEASSPAEQPPIGAPPDDPIVTPRKREERRQRVPDATTVIGGEDADRAGADEIHRLVPLVPSLSDVDPGNPVQHILTLRGVGNYGMGDPSVGFFEDGLYERGDTFLNGPLFDLDRIEVLKGPQTTLYGKSTIAGAINVIPKRPEFKEAARVRATVGTQALVRGDLMANGQMVEDVVAVRLAATFRQTDGFYDNEFNGRPRDDERSGALRLSLRARIAERIEVVPSVGLWERRGGAFIYHPVADDNDYRGQPYDVDQPAFADVHTLKLALPVTYDLGGGWRLASALGAHRAWDHAASDIDYSSRPPDDADPFANITVDVRSDRRDIAEELRIVSPDHGSVRFMAGAYVYLLRTVYDQRVAFRTVTPGPQPPPIASRTDALTGSAFGQVIWAFEDSFEATFGLRYDHDERDQHGRLGRSYHRDRSFDALAPSASISYSLSPDAMIYTSAALGFKPGGFNEGDFPAFGRERATSCEAGAKTAWLDGRLTANGAAFFTRLDDQQVPDLDPATLTLFTRNDGQADIFGCEVEVTLRPHPTLRFGASVTLVQAEYTDHTAGAIGPDGVAATYRFDGKRLPFVPAYSAAFSAEYRAPLTDKVHGFARAGASLSGDRYWDSFNTARQELFSVVSISAGIQIGAFEISAYGSNVFNEDYFTYFIPAYQLSPLTRSSLAVNGAPRSFGLMLQAEF